MSEASSARDTLNRIRRVADMLCTGHAGMRDLYAGRAFWLDLLLLAASTWLVALSFVDPVINVSLSPFGITPQLWVGFLGVVTFFLTIVQLKTDWKSRSDAHRRTLDLYAEVKREAGYLLAADEIEDEDYRRVLARYDMASAAGVELPEQLFLKVKKRHKQKIAISRYLDDRPFASLLMVRAKLWFRDNKL